MMPIVIGIVGGCCDSDRGFVVVLEALVKMMVILVWPAMMMAMAMAIWRWR